LIEENSPLVREHEDNDEEKSIVDIIKEMKEKE